MSCGGTEIEDLFRGFIRRPCKKTTVMSSKAPTVFHRGAVETHVRLLTDLTDSHKE